MVLITDLPDELLVQLVSLLEDDRPTLISITKTSRHFHDITRPFIFRHVELMDDASFYVETAEMSYTSLERKEDLLHRSFSQNPDLEKFVWSCDRLLSLQMQRASINSSHPQLGHLEMESLERYPNLREATFHCFNLPSSYHFDPFLDNPLDPSRVDPSAPFLFASATIERLKTFKLVQPRHCAIVACTKLHNLRTLVLQDCKPEQFITLQKSSSSVQRLEIITTLDFGRNIAMPPDAIGTLLSSFSAIVQLRVQVKLGAWVWSDHPPCQEMFILEVKTSEILTMLSSVSANIETLEIVGPSVDIVMQNVECPIRFHDFRKMRRLTIAAIHFFGRDQAYSTRDHLFKDILPQNIEELHIIFSCEIGVFYGGKEKEIGVLSKYPPTADSYFWLLQFPALKNEGIPNLKKLCLSEGEMSCIAGYEGKDDPCGAIRSWEVAEEVRTAYAHSGIGLDVRICVGHYDIKY